MQTEELNRMLSMYMQNHMYLSWNKINSYLCSILWHAHLIILVCSWFFWSTNVCISSQDPNFWAALVWLGGHSVCLSPSPESGALFSWELLAVNSPQAFKASGTETGSHPAYRASHIVELNESTNRDGLSTQIFLLTQKSTELILVYSYSIGLE